MGMAAATPSEAMEPANSKETAANGVEIALVGGDGADSSSLKRKRDEEIREEEEETVPGSRDGSVKRDPYWKTSLCSYFRSQRGGAGCSHGDACRYAHGEAELRPRPDNTWDPTSERAKTLKAESDAKVESLEAEDQPDAVDLSSLDKCLIGLPKKWSSDNLKSFLDGQGVLYETARKKKGMTVGFICFENVQQLKDAIKVLNENSACANKKIKVADAIRRPYDKKSEMKNSSNQTKELGENELCTNDAKSLVLPCSFEVDDEVGKDICIFEGSVSKTRTARDVVTPLADMPYVDQLDQKKNSLMQTLKKLTRNARKACPSSVALPEWIIKSRENGGLPCKLEGILESPLTNGYRNKCEFSVGYSLLGKPTVGFMVGTFREGITAIEEPINCPNVSRIASEFALIFQEFLQSSMLPAWNRIENKGFWRQFTVREGRKPCLVPSTEHAEIQIAEVMLIVQICSSDIDEEVQKTEFQRMVQALALGAAACSPPLPVTVIVLQDYKGISNAAPADCPLIPLMVPDVEGQLHSENKNAIEARIHDYISNLRFSISPTAFFQVNTLAAEKLYSLAGDWADLNSDTLLFDICCGTGTIGLTLAHRVGMVVGIEMNASAVSDAQRNAAINGIKNCRFICSKAEDIMGALLKEYLDVPEQPPVASDVSRISCTGNDYLIDGTMMMLLLQLFSSRSADVLPVNANEMLCPEYGTDKILDITVQSTDNYDRITCEAKLEGPVDGKLSDSSMAVDDGQENDLNDSAGTGGNCAAGYSDIAEDKQICKEPFQDTPTSEDKDGEGIPQFKNVVAIVDPPRVGLHPVVIKVLRTHPRITRLIYISCNPESLVANAIELCTPTADEPGKAKGNRGWRKMSSAGLARLRTKSMPKSAAFQPVRAMAVDMFPHTQHCEMVMLLER